MPTIIFGEGPGGDASGNHKDTHLNSLAVNFSFASDATLCVGRDGPVPMTFFSTPLMCFDISAIPAGSTITAATLRLFLSSTDGAANRTINLHRMITQWGVTDTDEGVSATPAVDGQATFSSSFSTFPVPPATPWIGGNFNFAADAFPLPETNFTVLSTDGAGTMYDIPITALVTGWYDGTNANRGLCLDLPLVGPGQFAIFHSQSAVNAALRPSLTVVYTVPTPPAGDPDNKIESYTGISVASGIGM